MAKNIVVVESPAKCKTLKKYLGKDFDIYASYGHVRDLEPKEGAVDPDDGFKMKYKIIERNKKHVDDICKALRNADSLYLATDPDREGEAISWHLKELISEKRGLKNKNIYRVSFHEITRVAVQNAIKDPKDLNLDLVNAQQARRALDYLVGFKLSPLLWKKIRRGLSAGRVQSPALRMIVEREKEIEKFEPKEYWTIDAELIEKNSPFTAKLIEYKTEKLKQFTIVTKDQAHDVKYNLEQAANGKLKVELIKKSQRKRNPAAPFTTSTLQQEAVRKLGFSAYKTMRVAQQLYEGVDFGEGATGLITYMRTDSVNLSNDALTDIRRLVSERYGDDNLPEEPRIFKSKAKNAQEAHEAIRPTIAGLLPDKIKGQVTDEQYKLYNLIWKRTIACQMIHATMDQVSIDLSCGDIGIFRATGSTVANAGFMQVYLEGVDDSKVDDKDRLLPKVEKGDMVDLKEIKADQHFTEPPPRFTEASLVKTLEEYGIGRPSTYASIISTLQNREYVELVQKRFSPTDVGVVVSNFLTNYFTKYVDYDFTANLEDSLDAIAAGNKKWIPLLEEFWKPFIDLIKLIGNTVERKDVTQEKIDEKCPKCSKDLSIRLGKRGKFIGCTGFPDCDFTKSMGPEEETPELEKVEGRACPKCESDLVIKFGKYGKFIGCSGYPNCKFIESLVKPEPTGISCPSCNKGELIKRKTRYGSFFYPCDQYPDCKYALKYEPIKEPCPNCDSKLLMLKVTKRSGTEKVCPEKTCGFKEKVDTEESD